MSKKLKGVIFSINNVLTPKTGQHPAIYSEIERLLKFLRLKSLQPIVLANRPNEALERQLKTCVGEFPWFICFRDGLPAKQTKEATTHVLSKMGWDATEAVYIGNTPDDMRTARNRVIAS
jgi:phosphoglycolate phosphatase-like HAD superfamily hydrolase